MKVLLLSRYGRLGASSRVRFLQYLPYFQSQDVEVTVEPLLSDAYLRTLYLGGPCWLEVLTGYGRRILTLFGVRRFDMVIIEKELFPLMPAVAERFLRAVGVPYLVDYDDALFHRYDLHANWWVRALLGHKIDEVMRRAQIVVAGNEYLAERARSAGAQQVEVVPTVVDSERYAPLLNRKHGTPLVIGWIGTPKTSRYLQSLIAVFERLQIRHDVRFVAVGVNEADFAGTPVEPWEWSEATEVASIQHFDIGIMPLEDSPWERGKCGYKLIQYMACGVPVVASPVGVNREIVQPGGNGFLATTAEEWENCLERLIAMSPNDRAVMGAASRERVVKLYSLNAQSPRLLAAIRKAVL